MAQLEWQIDQKQTDKRIQELGLNERYTRMSLGGTIRDLLYSEQNFDAVEDKLERIFARSSEPMKACHYSALINALSTTRFSDSSERLLEVLNPWVEAKPESYRALLVREHFHHKYAWYFRGTDWDVNVLEADNERFKAHLALATEDLKSAYRMNPDDAGSSAALINTWGNLPDTHPSISTYYKQAMIANPLHIQAWGNYLNFLRPCWGGMMNQVIEVAKDIEKASKEFPLLLLNARAAHENALEEGEITEEEWDGIHFHPKWVGACIEQHERCPDDLYLLNHVANKAYYAHEYERAIEYFEKIGDRYLEDALWDSLLDFHETRTYAYAASAFYTNNFNTIKGEKYAQKALKLMPDDPFCHNVYGNIMLDRNRLIEARSHFMKALEADPEYATVMCSLVYVSFAEDGFVEATQWAKQGLEHTGDPKMKEDLKKIIQKSKKEA